MIMTSSEFRDALRESIAETRDEIVVVSAFVTCSAVSWLGNLVEGEPDVKIVARWRPQDLQVGASDFESYRLAKNLGYRFFIDPVLHTKAYMFDRQRIFIGSANFTSNGLWLDTAGNDEMVTMVIPDVRDVSRLATVVAQATELSDGLVAAMEGLLKSEEKPLLEWPEGIGARLGGRIEGLWVADLPGCSPAEILNDPESCSAEIRATMSLLGGGLLDMDASSLRASFRSSKAYIWLMQVLGEAESIRFGALSAALHSVLVDDPAPFRKDVKYFVRILFDWVDFISEPGLEIVSYGHTKSIIWRP